MLHYQNLVARIAPRDFDNVEPQCIAATRRALSVEPQGIAATTSVRCW